MTADNRTAGLPRRAAAAARIKALYAVKPDDERYQAARTAALNTLGIPADGPAEGTWNTDLFTETTTDLAAGHPLAGRSPWGRGD